MKDAVTFWDGIADKYSKTPISDMESYEYTLNRTRSYLTQSDRVLEVGAGTGRTALSLASQVGEIVVTDLSDAMLDVGRAEAKADGVENISFERCDAGALPEGPFDVVLAHNILHLIDDLDGSLSAMHRALKPGGLMISKTFCKPEGGGGSFKITMMRMILPLMQMVGKAPFVAIRSVAEFEAAIWAAGFETVETMTVPKKGGSRYVVARKIA
ncbi:MAG: class I SAM-dependent methyltransferase [Cognatishimia sp.]